MSRTYSGEVGDSPIRRTAPGLADGLRLAAAPTFAVMALLSGLGGPSDMLCAAAHASPLSGMVPMYLLMSAFHAGPWLRRLSARPGGDPIS
jgi:hypothetical protein